MFSNHFPVISDYRIIALLNGDNSTVLTPVHSVVSKRQPNKSYNNGDHATGSTVLRPTTHQRTHIDDRYNILLRELLATAYYFFLGEM